MATENKMELALEQIHQASLKLRQQVSTDEARHLVETIIACCEDKAPAVVHFTPSVKLEAAEAQDLMRSLFAK